jgi:hypothetical protein
MAQGGSRPISFFRGSENAWGKGEAKLLALYHCDCCGGFHNVRRHLSDGEFAPYIGLLDAQEVKGLSGGQQ